MALYVIDTFILTLMIDYSFKSKVLSSELFQEYKKISKSIYIHNCSLLYDDFKPSSNVMDSKKAGELLVYYQSKFPKEWKECSRLSKSHRKRVLTLKHRVQFMLIKPCIFLTLTFNDNSLNSLTEKVRRKYVQSFLCSLDCLYIANQDFGKTNGREHYHAIVQCDNVDYHKWRYGAINGLRIRTSSEDVTRVSKYIAKLTNHAIKSTNKRNVIMYSKNFKSILDYFYMDGVL